MVSSLVVQDELAQKEAQRAKQKAQSKAATVRKVLEDQLSEVQQERSAARELKKKEAAELKVSIRQYEEEELQKWQQQKQQQSKTKQMYSQQVARWVECMLMLISMSCTALCVLSTASPVLTAFFCLCSLFVWDVVIVAMTFGLLGTGEDCMWLEYYVEDHVFERSRKGGADSTTSIVAIVRAVCAAAFTVNDKRCSLLQACTAYLCMQHDKYVRLQPC